MTSTLIIGATGLLGSEMAKASARNGDRLHVLVRAATAGDEERLRSLKELGAEIHVGDLDDYDSLVRAAGAVDRVISSVHVHSASEMTLVRALRDAGVSRYVPSAGFGLDFAAAAPGSIPPLDLKRGVFDAIRQADLPYTVIYTNGFFSTWVATLGDLMRFGSSPLPPDEVTLYGGGDVPATFVSEKDIAAVTLRALNDPKANRSEIRIARNKITQNEMIDLWRRVSGRSPRIVPQSAAELEAMIASAPWLGLLRAFWIRGETALETATPEAGVLYPELAFETIESAFVAMADAAGR
ncbi:NAD-dependent epimerase/dehydratase family protein [Mesorhizobium sp. M7A.F.Ca.CA.001.09.2.1]|uniref:NmrA family NAD(P)-binding protein n=5 Tax=Mesorhizobium TaxID=68287 RepID=A0AB38TIY1_9HYPH|nr:MULTISPECIES: NmrA family NAD(P)-binding protein [Mesorhizobium]MDF3212472.1 NmrA family NAD(P)-binding protein [Mesorhizobium ciceri]RUY63694.1 NAD-dependent epimerase/dehydratase family protein [Mesorhizobium sp. M7A.F.Ca.CA.001.13.1.1]RUY75908.1 NAD-dependent epimerase/dehydratase family protein [Mesorhizobium sp. M7A.F.Ca.CA.001.09.2.1]RUZ04756.1 NAD-dependent epimerase/dehydratase family protein [Mesorhizobium sp. M7A.F.Ca.CA.001.04.2.1]RUZ15059.1 NAD-dependent epimerase/dehydratase fa